MVESKRNKMKIIGGTAIGLIIFISIFAVIYAKNQEASLLQTYDPEEDSFWSMVSGDVIIFGLFDEIKNYEETFHQKDYFLLKNEILSIDDQGVDKDQIPDLLINSGLLIGNEELGITIPQYFDLNALALVLSQIGYNFSDTSEPLILPIPSSMHIVSSDFLTLLDIFSNGLSKSEDVPTYSFEYSDTGDFYVNGWKAVAGVDNNITIEQMTGSRNWSKGVLFGLGNNQSDCYIMTEGLPKIETQGSLSFFTRVDPETNIELFFVDPLGEDPFVSNGIILMINSTGAYQFEGKRVYFNNGLIQQWIENEDYGNWTKVGDVSSDWNNISISYPTEYNESISLKINGQDYTMDFSIEDSSYPFQINQLMFMVNGTNGGNVELDDIRLYNEIDQSNTDNALQKSLTSLLTGDFPMNQFLRELSIYNGMFFPKVFNYDGFYDFLNGLFDLIDRKIRQYLNIPIGFSDVFDLMVHNSRDQFSIEISNGIITTLKNKLIDAGLDMLSNVSMTFVEGNTNWTLKTTWDKQIGVLNSSTLFLNYTDLGYTREIGMKLISTRSPKGVQDSYYYYNNTWFSENEYIRVSHPYAKQVSLLNDDRYPSQIPREWDRFNKEKLTEMFLDEFDYNSIIDEYVHENLGIILGGGFAIIGGSVGVAFGVDWIIQLIRRKTMKLK